MKTYEVVIIGGGPGGYQSALELGKAGVDVLLVDKDKEKIGGTCLNIGCIPTKNYLESASFAFKIPHFVETGLAIDYNGLNLKQLREKTIALITEIRTGVLWMLEQSKVELLYGTATFADEKTIDVDGEKIGFEKCIIAAGSLPRELPGLPFDSKTILSSSDIFDLEKLPSSIAIVGAGPIACEMASFFNSFGVEVTIIARSSQILSREDKDVSKALLRVFKKLNINIIASATIEKSVIKENGIELFLDSKDLVECELVLSAVGRTPNTKNIKLENAGVKLDEKGFIDIEPSFVTSQKHIYAIGDCINTPAFAHTAYAEAKIVAKNIINSEKNINTHISPSIIFTNPQIASCGLNEKEAQEQGYETEVKKAYFKANSKAKIHGDDSGFAKVVIDSNSGLILGATIIGVEATEIIHELVFAVEKKLTIIELREVIHAHPTVAEIISYL